jgi:hypothetical protein
VPILRLVKVGFAALIALVALWFEAVRWTPVVKERKRRRRRRRVR